MKKFFAILFLGIIVLAGQKAIAASCDDCEPGCSLTNPIIGIDDTSYNNCVNNCKKFCTPTIYPIEPPAETTAAASNNSNNSSNNGIAIKNPLGENATIPQLANRFISVALGLSGILALIAFIYGGVMYLTAGINPKNVDTGKKVMIWAVAGLFLIFSSYAIVNFILKDILGIK